jgi:paraquat-inducible protein A
VTLLADATGGYGAGAGTAGRAARRRRAPELVECPDCGLRLLLRRLPARSVARCRRCHAHLRTAPPDNFDVPLALAMTGLVLVAVANLAPFMSLSLEGRSDAANLTTGAMALAAQGMWPVSALILGLTVAAPALKLGGTFYVLFGLQLPHPLPQIRWVLRWLDALHPWSMIEVYMLGIFVAYVKLADLATIGLGTGVFALAALMVVMATVDVTLDYHAIWDALEERGLVPPPPAPSAAPMARCSSCTRLGLWQGEGTLCQRCGARLHQRKPASQSRCWALIITAAILYVPANIYPILTLISFGSGAPDTILSGVKHLFQAGMWPLAILVFFASITVPVLKIGGLVFLLLTTERGLRGHLHDRTILYRIIDSIGRWSMIDIFMLSILVALVRLGAVASVTAGLGALSFSAVVVITMFAAMSFDPRLMWDAAGENG